MCCKNSSNIQTNASHFYLNSTVQQSISLFNTHTIEKLNQYFFSMYPCTPPQLQTSKENNYPMIYEMREREENNHYENDFKDLVLIIEHPEDTQSTRKCHMIS